MSKCSVNCYGKNVLRNLWVISNLWISCHVGEKSTKSWLRVSLNASAPSPMLSDTWLDERLLIRLVPQLYRIKKGYPVKDSYIRRDPQVSQHGYVVIA